MHKYKPADISTCLQNRRVVFFGDSTIRQIFWSVAKALDPKADESSAEKHHDIVVEKDGVKLEFIWDPFLNTSRVGTELSRFDGKSDVDAARPALVLMGTGLWYARFENINGLKMWKDHIDNVVQHMRSDRTTTDMTRKDLVLLAPVPVPVWNKLSPDRREAITPREVTNMNQYLQQLSGKQGIDVLWSYSQIPKGQPQCFENSGIHLEKSVVAVQAEILLNLRCNAELPPHYPYDKTCCNKYEPPNYQQWLGLAFVLAGLPSLLYMSNRDALRRYRQASDVYDADDKLLPPRNYWWLPSYRVIHAMIVFGVALVYCFYADRTQVFSKSNKHYTASGFALLSLIPLVTGIASFRKCSKTASDQPFLFRDQTDEWKGWMQAAILVYHYTGASKIAWIYGFIRVTVASYLFMTGYGHTVYFIKKGDYSFKRVAAVLVRLNLLSCILPYIMKTDYMFYYFAPLTSWWFLIVYTTMRVGAKYNSNARFLIGKIVVSAAITTAITRVPGVLEAIFEVPHLLAFTEWSVKEWRFRVFLDMWIVYFGMLVAVAFVRLSDTSPHALRLPTYRKFAIIASLIALPAFFFFQMTRETKYVYNAYHPYLSWIPIGAFIVLRNATPRMRNAYSFGWAWLGKCSLETFTLQFHIWLAADTRGLLNFGIFGEYRRFENFFVATIIFLFVSYYVSEVTGVLSGWIMGVPERKPTPPASTAAAVPDVEANGKEGIHADSVSLQNIAESSRANRSGSGGSVIAGAVETSSSKWAMYWRNLKVRCAVMLLAMWILNMVSHPCPD